MSSKTYPLVGGHAMRATKLDRCGRPAYGEKATITSEGFVSVAITANYEDGEEVSVTNAKGRKCVQKDAEAELINLGADITFCEADPELYTTFTGMPRIINPLTGDTTGFRVNSGVRPGDVRVALEVWSDAAGTVGCEGDEDTPWGYLLWAFLSGGRVSDYTIENNAVTFTVSGMITKKGGQWGEGPFLIQLDETGNPAPLEAPWDAEDHQYLNRVFIAPPAPTIGLVPLDDPDEPDATGATAGVPGVFTPAKAVRPYDFDALEDAALTATPSTAWTTGQAIVLGDGSEAHWDGDSWAEGRAV